MNASKFTIAIAATLITLLLLAGVRAGWSDPDHAHRRIRQARGLTGDPA